MAGDQLETEPDASAVETMEPWVRVLKVFVVVTGIILVIGTMLFIYLFLERREVDRMAAIERETGPAIAIAAPPDAEIQDVRLEGSRALLVLAGADGRNYLLFVDLARGERINLVVLD